MINRYEAWLIEALQKIDNFPYEDIKLLDKYPLEVSKQVLNVLIIEHKTEVDYNVVMQLFRYMCYIWEDYEKEIAKQSGLSSSRKDFRYPPILPIVYYEGRGEWTAVKNFKERIFLSDVFAKYIPDFSYELISLRDYTGEHLIQNQDEISLIMLLNKLQDAADFKELPDFGETLSDICRNTPEYLLETIARITSVLLYRLSLPEDEVDDLIGRIKERNMPELFEHFKGFNVPEVRQEGARECKMRIIKNLLKKGMADAEIMELAECGQELIDEVRGAEI